MADRELTTDPPTEMRTKRKRPWLRRVGVVVVVLLAGAIINVLVAWGCAYWSVGDDLDSGFFSPAELTRVNQSERDWLERFGFRVVDGEDWAYGELNSFGISRRGYCRVDEHWLDFSGMYWGSGSFLDDVAVTRVGWPFYALTSIEKTVENERYMRVREYQDAIVVVREFDIGGPIEFPRPLPLRPILVGFSLDSVLYGLLVWAIACAPRTYRKWKRRRKNDCPSCGYDLRGADHGKCPECGVTVVRKRRQPNSRTAEQVAD